MKTHPLNFIIAFILMMTWGFHATSQSWIKVQEIDSTDVYSVIEHNGSLYATSSVHIYKSSDGGSTWQSTPTQPNAPSGFNTLFSHSGYIYLGTAGDGIFRSADGGQSWLSFNSGLTGGAGGIIGFAALGDSLYAGTSNNGIYVRNLQTTSSWSTFNAGLFQLGTISIAASGTNVIASVGYYLFARPQAASQWTDVSVDSIQRYVFETLALGQNLYVGTDNGVYRGTLDAQNWERADIAAFPNQDIVALTAHGSRLIAGLSYFGQHWIFSTDDYGATWDFRTHELAEGWDLFVSGNRLWAGRSDGLWYIDMDIWTGIEIPELTIPTEFDLSQNYPNPFNPATRIAYQINQPAQVNLDVFDIHGKHIETLISEYKNAGKFEVNFDGSHLASGIYVYRLRVDNDMISRKMILVK